MKNLRIKICFVLCCMFALVVIVDTAAMAATPGEIEASIENGIEWLVAQQQPDGSWSEYNPGGETGLALVKLQERAFELGYDSPFDPNYPYSQAVEDGLGYLFSLASVIVINPQIAGDPDTNGNGIGVYVTSNDWHRTYETGIALMAVASSKSPGRIVNSPRSPVDGWTYAQVMQEMVDYLAWGQVNAGQGRGGWGYTDEDEFVPDRWADNSNSGYAVLGLAYAEAAAYGFSCTIPAFVKSELNIWIDYVQNDVDGDADDGGSGYEGPVGWVNVLKTGNLIFEMAFFGDGSVVPRVQDAMDYLGRTWNNPSQDPGWGNPVYGGTPHYQAMYCVMKGLEYRGIDTVEVDGVERDWYADFADAIVNTQQPDGSWPWDIWGGQLLATEWALLTLEKSAPPIANISGQCILAGEMFDAIDLDETIDPLNPGTPPYTWTVSGNVDLLVDIDVDNVMTVTYSEGWTGSEVLTITGTDAANRVTISTPTYTVCAVPVVLDIPDQTVPFEPFDLDDYLSGMAPEDVEWSASEPPEGWSVEIDGDNVVTVTAPEEGSESATITFTATSTECPCDELSDSDDATFTINEPPDVSEVYPSVSILLKPNHKWVDISILGITDPDGDPVTITITGITQDEPTMGSGSGQTCPDGAGVGTGTARVRAERDGNGDGRTYQISFDANDGAGGTASGAVTVCVPHNNGDASCVDSGQAYDSTVCN